MDSVCPECGEESLEVEVVEKKITLVCSTCGNVVDLHKENESTQGRTLSDDEDEDDFDDENANLNDSADAGASRGTAENETLLPSIKASSCRVGSPTPNSYYYGSSIIEERQENKEPTPKSSITETTPTCKGCGGNDLALESINETEQLVCLSCGYFVEREELVSTVQFTNISGSFGTYQWTRAPLPKFVGGTGPVTTKGKEAGLSKIKAVSRSLSLRSDLEEQALRMFESIYPTQNVIFASMELKETLAACCVLFVARENATTVTFKTMTSIHNAKRKLYTRALKMLAQILGRKLVPQNIVTLPEHVLAGAGFSPQLLHKVAAMVELCQQGFVSQGKDCTNLILVVAHATWISENQSQFKKTTLIKFCTKFSLPYTQHCEVMRKQVYEFLAKLASQLPWLSARVDHKKALLYIGDIVKYKQTVLKRAIHWGSSENDSSSYRSCHALLPPCLNDKQLGGASPPVVTRQFKMPAHLVGFDLDSKELSETHDVISPSEMDLYIVPLDEIPLRKRLLKL